MNVLKILLIIIAILYIISPVDLLPDVLIPWGWLDDGTLLALLIYYLKRGRLPAFFSWWRRPSGADQDQQRRSEDAGRFERERETQAGSKDPYEILGVAPGASREEIRSAYRRAAQAYHPDKVSHLGPELQQLAKKKFIEIQEAYEKLMGRGG
ncbi:MAG: DnaJ domain-containing protein [Deltaproteobacteria bacterium]|nr:DnaJ domain-containing protein [Deltaproteobacteria bacterium]